MVSWISRAIRCRSSPAPASLAWVSSWACSPVFSAIISSSRWLASASSAIMCLRASFCSPIFTPSIVKTPMRTTSTPASSTQMTTSDTVGRWNPPAWAIAMKKATTAQPTHRHAPVRVLPGVQEADPGEEREPRAADGEHGDEHQQPGEVDVPSATDAGAARMQDDHPGDPGSGGRGHADGDAERSRARGLGEHIGDERDDEQQVGHQSRHGLVPALEVSKPLSGVRTVTALTPSLRLFPAEEPRRHCRRDHGIRRHYAQVFGPRSQAHPAVPHRVQGRAERGEVPDLAHHR